MQVRPHRGQWWVAAGAAMLLVVAGCGGDDGGDEGGASGGAQGFEVPDVPMKQSVGKGEGELNVVAWAGYVEDGSTDPSADWVTPFEKETGCQVNVRVGATSDEMFQLMKTGEYDVVSASGDASLRLIAGGYVQPVNLDLVPNYKDIFPALKMQPWNSVDGKPYGIPHGRGANLLAWRTDEVKPAPTSWDVVFDDASQYKGKVTAYDNAIYIADAALYLMKHKPSLGIENPYALDQKQFNAAVDLLKEQNANVGEYWSDALKEIASFKSGDTVVGTTWQYQVNSLAAEKAPVEATLPDEGSTGWSDTWEVAADAQNPNCAYKWLDHVVSPEVNAQIAEWFGEAPANQKSCELTADPEHCATFHATDEAYFDKVWYWTTPIAQCLDGRENVECVDYADWVQAWTEIKG
ncbi:MAG: ABC transporter substrate-binding protein [Actinomycetes bacterium]